MNRNRLLAAVLLALLLAMTGCAGGGDDTSASGGTGETTSSDEAAAGEPIKIGEIIMLTGSSGFYGQAIDEGVQMAVDELNADGGVLDRQLEIVTEDNASDDAQTVSLVRRVAADGSVVALIAPTFTANYLAGQPVANEAAIPWIAAGSGIAVDEEGNIDAFGGLPNAAPWTFQNMLPYGVMVTEHLKNVLPQLDVQRVVTVFQPDNPAQVFTTDLGRDALNEIGVETLDEIGIETGAADFGAQITRIQQLNPDAVLINLVTEDAASFMRQARDRGVEARWIGPNNGLLSDRLGELSQGAAEGVIVPTHLDMDAAETQDFVKRFEERYDQIDDILSTFGYDAVNLIAEALEQSGSPDDREALRDALAEMEEFCGVNGCYANDGSGNFLLDTVYAMELTADGFQSWQGP